MPKTKEKESTLTIAQRAGYARRRLKNRGIETLKDHKGQDVPLDWIPDIDIVEHIATLELVEKAEDLRRQLAEFKHDVQTTGDEIHRQMLADEGVENPKIKNYSLTTMDKSHRLQFKRPPKYNQDEKELAISNDYKDKFFKDMAGEVPEYVVNLLEELTENSRGDIDQSKISKLNQLATKIKNKNFQKMVKHYNQSLDAYYAKRYEQFQMRDEQGELQSIVLTYASLKPQAPEDE